MLIPDSQAVTMMYVEDNADVRAKVRNIILAQFPDLHFHTAENGVAGLEMFRQHGADIILTDISMPFMNGIEMAHQIRMLSPDACIIIMTAHSDTRFLLEAIEVGIKRYVLKPIDTMKLFDVIQDCIAGITLKRRVKSQDECIRKLSLAIEQSARTVVITDAAGRIEYVNPKCLEITGYTRGELVGQTPRLFKSNLTPPEVYLRLWATITAGSEWRGELVNRKKNGELHWEALCITPLMDGKGEITHFVAEKEDLINKKKMERALVAHEEIKTSRAQLRNLSAHLLEMIEKERTAIAREIHDELGQMLATLQLEISLLADRYRDDQYLTAKTEAMEHHIKGLIKTVQEISTGLRPKMLDVLGLAEAVDWQAREFGKKSGITCETIIALGEKSVDQGVSTAFFRIVQEALTNVLRHSGATHVQVRLVQKKNNILLVVSDNGCGIRRSEINDHMSLGVTGMRERAVVLGGRLRIQGASGKGTTVMVLIPVLAKEN